MTEFRRARLTLALVFFGALSSPTPADTLTDPVPDIPAAPFAVRLELAATGLNYPALPTDVVHAHDATGRLFVAGLGGVVRVVQPDGSHTPFLDTTNPDTEILVTDYGMTSIAFHPSFAHPKSPGFRRFYTITTERENSAPADFGSGTDHQDVISEWLVSAGDPSLADPLSRREVLRINQPRRTHNVTDLAFDGAGLLHISVGDGGNVPPGSVLFSQHARNPAHIYGKILRIDPLGLVGAPSANGAYSIPPANPYVGVAGIDEVYAVGFRSPYRLNFDRATGDLWLGDVGQNSIESIDRVAPGADHGWNLKEGSFLFDVPTFDVCPDPAPDPLLVNPVGEYDHDDGRSVVAGFVYRGAAVPALAGLHVFADFTGPSNAQPDARLFVLDVPTGAISEPAIDPAGAPLPALIYSVGEDEDGELLLCGTDADGSNGRLLRIRRACPADLNADGLVNTADLGLLIEAFGSVSPALDVNAAPPIDTADLGLLLESFGSACP